MSRYTKSMTEALSQVDDRTQQFDEAIKWEVKITGLPTFYSDGKSRGEVKQALRKLLKRPDDIVSIERTTTAELKKIRRGQASGQEPGDEDEKIAEEVKHNRIIKAQKESLDLDDVVNMIQFGHPFKVVEDIPAELPPGNEDFPRYKDVPNSVVDKEDKKANKIKNKVEKDALVPTQTEEEVEMEGTSVKNWTKNLPDKKTGEAKDKMAAPPGNLRPYGAALKGGKSKIPNVAVSEEEIDELSKKTLGSYVKKAVPSHSVHHMAQVRRVADKRKKGINTAVDKLSKESVDKIAERLKKKSVSEVAPPGWGHTKAEKEKTKPNKPKSKIGGTAHEFQKDLDSGKFKGLPGDKTYKDKKASMFKLMWSMKNKGDKPHYKPGEKDKLKAKYKKEENLLDTAKRYVIDEKADWTTAFKNAAQSKPAMKYKDAASFIETAGLNSSEKRRALKAAKKWLK